MQLQLNNHNITCISVVFPKKYKNFYQIMQEFETNHSKIKLSQKNIGIDRCYICDHHTFASDLGSKALEQLLHRKKIQKNEIDMLLVATSTPDYLIPSVSNQIHQNLSLNNNTLCKDVLYYCSGFSQALFDAFSYLDNYNINKIVLISVLTKSKKIHPEDKMTKMTKSDSACAVLIEKNKTKKNCFYMQKIFSQYLLDETYSIPISRPIEQHFFKYNNGILFNIVQNNLPEIILNFLNYYNIDKNLIDCIFLHQPNLFFYKNLLNNLPFKKEKIYSQRLKLYGDTGINNNIIDLFLYKQNNNPKSTQKILMASYGAGITINSIIFDLNFNAMETCDIIFI